MKRKAHVSKSAYRALLSVQKTRDEKSGLFVNDRFFKPDTDVASYPMLWFIMDLMVVSCLVLGLMMLITTGFSVPLSVMFYPKLLLFSTGSVFLFKNKFIRKYWLPVTMAIIVIYLALVFVYQEQIITGVGQLLNMIIDTLNRVYSGNLDMKPGVYGGEYAETLLIFVSFIITIWISVALFKANNMLMIYLLVFPIMIVMMLSGAAGNVAALFIILFGIVLCLAFIRPRRQFRMWGGKNVTLYSKNKQRYESVQKRSIAIILALCIAMSVPGFIIVRPFLSLSLKPAEEMSVKIQNGFLNKMIKVLPELSAGKWNLNLDAVGGGVQEGSLSNDDGYLLEGVEDLKLTLDRKPLETLYLKGFVGYEYEKGSWKTGYTTTFDGTALNWNLDGNPRIYIQNLQFLRMSYALSQTYDEEVTAEISKIPSSPVSVMVEKINANDKYTYVPYGVYLNDYYEVNSGDGYIEGQKETDDIYYFYPREDVETVFNIWNELEDTNSVLDRTENSYASYCKKNYVNNNYEYEELNQAIVSAIDENGWKTSENIEEISGWIRQYINDNYEYKLIPDSVPEGQDELEYFINTSKTGNSVQFASTAVVMFRIAGIPARYVVGYEVPAGLFAAQPDGSYTAIVEGDNSQAWVEIYIDGIGWMPKDMTPGVIGSFEEVGPGGEKIETVIEDKEDKKEQTTDNKSEEKYEPKETVKSLRIATYSVEQIVNFMAVLILVLLVIAGHIVTIYKYCRDYGYDIFGKKTKLVRALFIFRAIYNRLIKVGLPAETDSQSSEFIEFAETELSKRCRTKPEPFDDMVNKIYECCYGNGRIKEEDIIKLRQYLKILRKFRFNKR